uniref:Uncharacterized protein n=1 Tax=Anguilla anguilla TaxID=7936 RepID=A0A0E9WZ58_ANGAN
MNRQFLPFLSLMLLLCVDLGGCSNNVCSQTKVMLIRRARGGQGEGER